jgi:outer membrane protein TolC
MKTIFILAGFLFIMANSIAQKLITAEEAVSIALKNNYGILISGNESEISRVNNTAGNAGMLPNISANASDNYSINTIKQVAADGTESNYNNVRTNTLNAAVSLNWTVFDGGKMFITKSKLNEIQAKGELQYKETVLQTMYDVITAYYFIVKQKQQLASINNALLYNEERVKIFQTSFNAGLSPKTNLLQAKIDLNVNRENAISQEHTITIAKRNLNQLLSRNIDSVSYEVIDSFYFNYNPDKSEIIKKITANNASVLMFQKQIEINSLAIKELNASRLPKLNFNAGYGFNQSDYTKGNLSINRNFGPQIGASISIPLFQGGSINRQISIARLELKSSETAFEGVKTEVNTQLNNALEDFENQKELLNIENENSELARENLDIAMQRLRFGQTTSLEVKLAQESYENSQTRLINFKYSLKIAETKLKQLIAEL